MTKVTVETDEYTVKGERWYEVAWAASLLKESVTWDVDEGDDHD